MRLKISKSKHTESLSIIKYVNIDGKDTSRVVENLGNIERVREKAKGQDPYEWARQRAQELTRLEKKAEKEHLVKFSTQKLIDKEKQLNFNIGYLFLQKLYTQLRLDKLVNQISENYKFDFDLNAILAQLIYTQLLFPSSKKESFEKAKTFLEQPDFQLHHIYRALDVLAKESSHLQEVLYKNSLKVCKRQNRVLYYDCTNFYFEIEQEDDFRRYGHSKENRPNPIVQLGLFMDGNGIPLAFTTFPGNQNEQHSLKPLEKKIARDFKLSELVVCTDAGLSSLANRKFNDFESETQKRSFLTTQSLKNWGKAKQDWALDPRGWRLPGKQKTYTLEDIHDLANSDLVFYKENVLDENGLCQRFIVTYSLKYKLYQENVRQGQIDRAMKWPCQGGKIPKKVNANDYRRFIQATHTTEEGEIADREKTYFNQAQQEKEAKFDGFYAVATNLTDDPAQIIALNQGRWEIEESFRLMKSEFKLRPVNLSREERIKAHFTIGFMGLTLFRILQQRVKKQATAHTILETLRQMNVREIKGEGYLPNYKRTDFTDCLHQSFGIRTDYEMTSLKQMKNILKWSKSE
jgi:hypothetical protein